MCMSPIHVLKGQPDSSPGQSEATPWVSRIIIISALFLLCAGKGPAQNRKRENRIGARLPKAAVAATSALGYYRAAPPGRRAEPTGCSERRDYGSAGNCPRSVRRH